MVRATTSSCEARARGVAAASLTEVVDAKAAETARRRRVRIWRRRGLSWALPLLGPPLIGLLHRSWRVQLRGTENLDDAMRERGVFIALWHGRMLLGLSQHGYRGWNVLVSPSDDGALAKIMLERNGYQIVRGSSSRGGSRAVRDMMSRVRDAPDAQPGDPARDPCAPDRVPAQAPGRVPDRAPTRVVIVTPDGPRGPRHSTNPGLAWLSRETGCAILPLGLACDRAWHARSWDDFTVPRPGARVQMSYGELMRVPADADDEALAAFTRDLASRLIQLEQASFEDLGRGWDHPSA